MAGAAGPVAPVAQRKRAGLTAMSGGLPTRTAVILTAIKVETAAIRARLTDPAQQVVSGTIFTVGGFKDWRIAVARTGDGNSAAAVITERAMQHYKPEVALFVGVAGGVKDVRVGDVVVGGVVYAYDKGKLVHGEFLARSDPYRSDYGLEQLALSPDIENACLPRIFGAEILGGVIISGEKVVGCSKNKFWKKVKKRHSDATAVEMEGHGFGVAIHRSEGVRGLIIRGISDLLDGKKKSDAKGGQQLAASNAAELAFAVLGQLPAPPASPTAVEIGSLGTGYSWAGPISVDRADKLWKGGAPTLRIGIPPNCGRDLRDAILRLLLHADPSALQVEVADKAGWVRALERYLGSALPWEGLDPQTEGWSEIEPIVLNDDGSSIPAPASELAARIEDALDGATIRRLDGQVRKLLTGDQLYTWGLQSLNEDLAEALLALWEDWQGNMTPPERRRFFDLLVSFDDGDVGRDARIGVGYKSVDNCLVVAVVLALAVARCCPDVWPEAGASGIRPHERVPGNVGNGTLFAHCCGARMVRGDLIDHVLEEIAALPWSSRIVILSGVRTPARLAALRAIPLDRSGSSGLLNDPGASETVAFGFDSAFKKALAEGENAVRRYLKACLDDVRRTKGDFITAATDETPDEGKGDDDA